MEFKYLLSYISVCKHFLLFLVIDLVDFYADISPNYVCSTRMLILRNLEVLLQNYRSVELDQFGEGWHSGLQGW